MAEIQDRYIEMFLDEAGEHIESLNQNLLIIEREGADPEVINEIFRSAHTLKSSAAFVGLESLSDLAHKMEDLLQGVREGRIGITTELISLFFECLDKIKSTVARFGEGEKSDEKYEEVIERLSAYMAKGSEAELTPEEIAKVVETSPPMAEPAQEQARVEKTPLPGKLILDTADESLLFREANGLNVFDGLVTIEKSAQMKNMRLLLLVQHLKNIGKIFNSIPRETDLEGKVIYDSISFIFIGDISDRELASACSIDSVERVQITKREVKGGRKRARREDGEDEAQLKSKNIKVSSEKIDYLLNSVGELVITNSGLQKIYEDLQKEIGDSSSLNELKSKIDQAARIARDLQSGIMKTRMIPIGLVFNRYTRPVRDIALELGKEVELAFQGEDTELDKNIIDSLNDPLMHLLRNALDHGVETKDERLVKGKPPKSKLLLNAFQSGNNIYVEIRDDGRGLNLAAILKKGRERGLIGEEKALSEDEIYQLIFHPGFSTAEKITDISGRGVGMNVVKEMVESFKGTIQIQNNPGQGCSFILSFPMTLAIISAILVEIGREVYAFPLSDVVETIRVSREDITTLQGKDIINLRGDILPVYDLAVLLGLPPDAETPEFPIVVANVGTRKVGFMVKGMLGKKEIVIKTLDKNFRSVRGFVGACLMGDGSIVMVIDVLSLLDLAHMDYTVMKKRTEFEILDNLKKYNEHVQALIRRGIEKKSSAVKKRRETREEAKAAAPAIALAAVATGTAAITSVAEAHPIVATISPAAPSVSLPPTPPFATVEAAVPVAPGRFELSEEERLEKALIDFRQEKSERISRARDILTPEEQEPSPALTEEEYNKLYAVVNTGMINAGFVLSQLLGVKVEVSVPEFQSVDFAEMRDYIPHEHVIAVTLNTEGDFNALLMLVFDEETGYRAAGDLMGLPVELREKGKMQAEDVYSVLNELTNIVGSSVLNALANKTGMTIYPTVPTYIHGKTELILNKIDEIHTSAGEFQIIYVSTDFYREDMELLGRMFFIPSGKALTQIIEKI
jgi:two-component system chemotaxis sensor kinase CheA